ncbi:hypothetical protein ACFL0L_03530 [Patescibacteria group bacterium]
MISIFYIIILYIITSLLPMEWYFVKAIIGLPAVIIFPITVGRTVSAGLFPLIKTLSDISRHLINWLIGVLLLFLAAYVSFAFEIFSWEAILFVFLGLTLVCTLKKFFRKGAIHLTRVPTKVLLATVVIIITSIVIVAFFRSYSPFPLQSGSDNIFLAGLSSEIINNDFSNSNFSVYSYAPFIPFLLAIISSFAHIDPIHALWVMPFLLYSVFGFGLFYFLNKKIHNIAVSLLVACGWLFIFGFEGRVLDLINFREKNLLYVLLPYFLILIDSHLTTITHRLKESVLTAVSMILPATLIAVQSLLFQLPFQYTYICIGLTFFAYVLVRDRIENSFIPIAVFVSIMLGLLHGYSGFFFSIMLSSVLLFQMKGKETLSRFGKFVTYSLIAFFGYVLFAKEIPDFLKSTIDSGSVIFGGQYNYSIANKIRLFIPSITLPVLFIGLLGILFSLKTVINKIAPYVIGFLIMLIAFFLPINFAFRLIEIIVIILALFVAIAIIELRKLFATDHGKRSQLIVIAMMVIILFSVVQMPFQYIDWIYQRGIAQADSEITSYNMAEYEAAVWVKDNYPDTTLIFTTPELTRSFTAISGKTLMLRSEVYEYQYTASYRTSAKSPSCSDVFINGYKIHPSNVRERSDAFEFGINTVEKSYTPNTRNLVRFDNCSDKLIPSLTISVNGEDIEVIAAKDRNEGVEFVFRDSPEARKKYPIAIFDYADDLRELRRQIFSSTSPQDAHQFGQSLETYYMEGLTDYININTEEVRTLIVVSGVAALWSRNELVTYNLAVPFEPFEGFEKFFDSSYFTNVFSIPGEVYVFELI